MRTKIIEGGEAVPHEILDVKETQQKKKKVHFWLTSFQ